MQISKFTQNFINLNLDNTYLDYRSFESLTSEIKKYDIEVLYDSIKDYEIFKRAFDCFKSKNLNLVNDSVQDQDKLIEIFIYSFDFDLEYYLSIDKKSFLSLQNIKNLKLILKTTDLSSCKDLTLQLFKYRILYYVKRENELQSKTHFLFFYEAYFEDYRNFKVFITNDNFLIYNVFIETDEKIIKKTYDQWLCVLQKYSFKEQFYLTINISKNAYFIKGFIIFNILKFDEMKDKFEKRESLDNLCLSKIIFCNLNELEDLCTEEYIKEYENFIKEESLVKYYNSSNYILKDILTQNLNKFESYLLTNKKNNLYGANFINKS
ncbi:hypothetical protein GVAV_002686 [Gurleya vavrai]